MNDYNSNFVSLDLSTNEDEEVVVGHLLVGHKGVKDIETAQLINHNISVLRIDTVANTTVDSIINTILKNIYKIRDNKIGWLPDIAISNVETSSTQVNIPLEYANNLTHNNTDIIISQNNYDHLLVQETLSEKLLQIDSSKIEFLVTKAEKVS